MKSDKCSVLDVDKILVVKREAWGTVLVGIM